MRFSDILIQSLNLDMSVEHKNKNLKFGSDLALIRELSCKNLIYKKLIVETWLDGMYQNKYKNPQRYI